MVAESRTGVDPHPTTADLSIYIDPTSSYLAQMWWDPNIATRLDGDGSWKRNLTATASRCGTNQCTV